MSDTDKDDQNERAATASKRSSRFMLKDLITITISVVALAISATNAYLSFFVQYDDVRAAIGEGPIFTINYKGELSVNGEQELTFINSGNRMMAINSVFASATKMKSANEPVPPCYSNESYRLAFEIEPFVLKGGEIVVRKLKIATSKTEIMWKVDKWGVTIPIDIFKPTPGDVYFACLVFNIATPDNYLRELHQPLYKYTLKKQEFLESLNRDLGKKYREMLFDPSKPVVIFKRQTTIFTATKS